MIWRLARSGAAAHLPSLVGPFLVLMLAGVLVSGTGVLIESGLRSGGDADFLLVLATSFTGTATMLVVFVVAATVSLALRQRQRDFALLRAVGATRTQVRTLVSAEVALVTLAAAPLGALVGLLAVRQLTPMLVSSQVVGPEFELTLSPLPVLGACAFLLPVAWLAARMATRGTVRTSPTAAVSSSVVEPVGIGPVRRVSALVVAAVGVAAAFSPAVLPGTLGAAIAAVSAFLLVGAAALAGPLLVAAALERLGRRGGPATRLALANARGFSRRLTTVVVPLALALGVGTVQASVDRTVVAAGAEQLRDGLQADLVVTGELDPERLDAVADLPGVEAAVPLAATSAQVRTDDEAEFLGALSWEPMQVRALPPGDLAGTLDLAVVDGDLARLDRPDTVAISSDARFETGKGVGDRIEIRWHGGEPAWAEVVAVHERGLGFGDYVTGRATPVAHGADVPADAVLVRTAGPGATGDVEEAAGGLGLDAQAPTAYVDTVLAAGDGQRELSAVLLLLLLVFVLLAAANALALATAGRREELTLLWRTGATGSQVLRMAAVEALATGAMAWLIGTLTVVPAVLGVSAGLLGTAVPPVAWAAYGVLSATVLAVPLLTVVPVVAGLRAGRGAPTPVVAA